MRVQKFTVESTDINAMVNGEEIKLDLAITPDQLNNDILPRIIRIDNATGGAIGYVVIGNDMEEVERIKQPTWYAPIPIEDGVLDLNLGVGGRFLYIVQLDDTKTCSGDLSLYFGNYFNY